MKKNILRNIAISALLIAALGVANAEEETFEAVCAPLCITEDQVFEAVCEPLFVDDTVKTAKTTKTTKTTAKESPKYYTEEQAIAWAQKNGLDGFEVVKTNSPTLNVGSKIFTDRQEAQDYLTARQAQVIAENGGIATIANGFVVTDNIELSLNIVEQHTEAYSQHPIAAKLPVLETEYTEYVPNSAKQAFNKTIAEKVGVDAKQVKQHTYLDGDVSYTRFTYEKNGEHFIAEYVRDTVTENGETHVVYRPTQVLSKKGSVYGNLEKDKVVGYAVYDISYLPLYQTVVK